MNSGTVQQGELKHGVGMETFLIKAGTQLPATRRNPPKYPFASIEVGQSFFAPGMLTKNFTTYCGRVGRSIGRKFATQQANMRRDLETGEWEPCNPDDLNAVSGVAVTRRS